MSVWLVTPRSLVAIGLLSAAVIACAPAGTTALNDAVDIVAVILRRVPMIIAETIVLFSVATAAAADRGTELRLPAPGPIRAAQSAPAAAAEDSVAIIAFSNISAVTEDDWIGMGIAEALTAELGRAGDLSVVGRQAVSGTAGFAAVPTTVIDGPPPPPADVPALDENRDAATPRSVRERLAKLEQHRANPVCASCHARMDPLGFALENFDGIGRWRPRITAFRSTPPRRSPMAPCSTGLPSCARGCGPAARHS